MKNKKKQQHSCAMFKWVRTKAGSYIISTAAPCGRCRDKIAVVTVNGDILHGDAIQDIATARMLLYKGRYELEQRSVQRMCCALYDALAHQYQHHYSDTLAEPIKCSHGKEER